MKTSRYLFVLAASALALTACAPPAPPPPDTAADEAALKADPGAWMESYNAGNADAIAEHYTDDALLMAPGAPAQQGKAAIREFIAADIVKSKAAGLKFNNGDATGVGVSGDMGWVSGVFTVTDASGATIDAGKYLSVFRRTNGQWKLIRDTWNSDMAPAAAAPAAPAEAAPAAN